MNEAIDRPQPTRAVRLPPRWFIRLFWTVQRAIFRLTGGRVGLQRATADRWGMMRLKTIGRRTGQERTAILGYFEDGPNLVTMAMNGWADPEPAWWLNLQAHPDTTVDLPDGPRAVHAHAANEDERPRLWAKWGPSTTRVSTPSPPGDREKPRSSSWSRGPIEAAAQSTRRPGRLGEAATSEVHDQPETREDGEHQGGREGDPANIAGHVGVLVGGPDREWRVAIGGH